MGDAPAAGLLLGKPVAGVVGAGGAAAGAAAVPAPATAAPALGADFTMCIALPEVTWSCSMTSASFRIRPLKITFICPGSMSQWVLAKAFSSWTVVDGSRSSAKVLPPEPEILKFTLMAILPLGGTRGFTD